MSNSTSTNSTGFQYIVGGLGLIFLIFPYVTGVVAGKPELVHISLLSLAIPLAGYICVSRGVHRLQSEGRLIVPNRDKISAAKAVIPVVASAVIAMIIIDQVGLLTNPPQMFITFFAATLVGFCVGLYLVGVRIIRSPDRG